MIMYTGGYYFTLGLSNGRRKGVRSATQPGRRYEWMGGICLARGDTLAVAVDAETEKNLSGGA